MFRSVLAEVYRHGSCSAPASLLACSEQKDTLLISERFVMRYGEARRSKPPPCIARRAALGRTQPARASEGGGEYEYELCRDRVSGCTRYAIICSTL